MRGIARPGLGIVVWLLCGSALAGSLPAGFYQVTSNDGGSSRMESVLFMHGEEFFRAPERRGDTGTVQLGVRAVFGKNGKIEGAPDALRWRSGDRKGRARLIEEGQGFRLDLFERANRRPWQSVKLRYLGTRPTDVMPEAQALARTYYLSHRGSARIATINPGGIYPSNTQPAFEAALRSGYEGFEFDVHVSRDGHVVVSHDDDLAVSTDCQGRITQSDLAQIRGCRVLKSGLIPESGIASDRSRLSAPLTTLTEVIERYTADTRARVLVVDVKPGDVDQQAQGLYAALRDLPEAKLKKVLILVRSDELTKKLRALGVVGGHVALEGSQGWEPLNEDEQGPYLDRTWHDFISLSLGLGLGLNGLGRGVGPTLGAVWNVLRGVPAMVVRADADIAYIGWSRGNLRRYARLLKLAHDRGIGVIGWTVNTPKKIKLLREYTPDLDVILSDLPFTEIARIQLRELRELGKQKQLSVEPVRASVLR